MEVSLNSELSVLAALSQAAQRRGRRHDVIIMVDLGDLREGLWPRDLTNFMGEALRLRGIRVAGKADARRDFIDKNDLRFQFHH